MDTANDLERLGLALRSLSSGMHPSGDDRRRRLLAEAKAMLAYVLAEQAGPALVRRYARAVEALRNGQPLGLPIEMTRLPTILALLDDGRFLLSMHGVEFAWRLDAATALAEATRQGARRFIGSGRNAGTIVSLIWMLRALTRELAWRLLYLACAPLLRRYMRIMRGC